MARNVLPLTFLALISFSIFFAGEINVDAPVDVSKVEAPDCKFCHNSGAGKCKECKGTGISLNAQVQCPICKGAKTFPCRKCDEKGLMKCVKCKTRKIEGESVRSIVNPEWEKWNEEHGGKNRKKDSPKEPAKYIKCTFCKGTGKLTCDVCNGTRKAPCTRCKGTGLVSGRGDCPECKGSGTEPCQKCCVLEGIDDLESIKALTKMKDDGLVSSAEYYKKRRLIVAQEKHRREVIAEREKKLAEAEAAKEKAEAEKAAKEEELAKQKAEEEQARLEEEKANRVDWEDLKSKHRNLLMGLKTSIFSAAEYESKLRTLGLSEDMVRDAEKAMAEEDPKVKKLYDLKEAFRKGKYDYEKYMSMLKKL